MKKDTDNAEERIVRMERIIDQLQKEAEHHRQVNATVIEALTTHAPDQPATPANAKPDLLRPVK